MIIADEISKEQTFFQKHFDDNKNFPVWGLSLNCAKSMRFRWNEENLRRADFFKSLDDKKIAVPIQLDHTKIVFAVKNPLDTHLKIGDGLISTNKNLILTVTVADCMPIFLFDPKTEVFGIVHSGWKGTGIIQNAIELACKTYGASTSDFKVVLGPHIHKCCYIVDEERANYFNTNFCSDCATEINENEKLPAFAWKNKGNKIFRLSLEKANLWILKKIGIKDENITVCNDCTCCNEIFGSNRRQTATGSNFNPMAAFIKF